MSKLGENGISLPEFVFAIMLVLLGVMTYYLVPMSFLFGHFLLFFTVLDLVLLIMILGMTLLSIIVFPQLSKLMLDMLLGINSLFC